MGNLSRILAVLTAFLSVVFLGSAVVTTRLGGPNWTAMAASLKPTPEDPHGYLFSESSGENAQWTATAAASGESIKSAKVLPDVIVAAYDHKISALTAEAGEIDTELPQLVQRKEALQSAITADEAALAQAVREREQFLEQLRQQYSTLSQQVEQQTQEGINIEFVVEARRKDVFRLQNQVEVLKTDDARIAQIEKQMLDLIRQIDANLEKAGRRQQQLKSRQPAGN